MSRHGDGDCNVDDNDDENLNERMITDPEGYPGKEGTRIEILILMKFKMPTIRMITVPGGIQPSEVGRRGFVETNSEQAPPFNRDFNDKKKTIL